jgi:hypothetical protein
MNDQKEHDKADGMDAQHVHPSRCPLSPLSVQRGRHRTQNNGRFHRQPTSINLKKAFISACENAGIEGLVWHDLRATYGTRLDEAGFNAYDLGQANGPREYFNESALRSQFASWRRCGSHAKKSAPSQYRHK